MALEILSYQLLRDDRPRWLTKSGVAAEETFELAGVSVMLYAALLLARTVSSAAARPYDGDTAVRPASVRR